MADEKIEKRIAELRRMIAEVGPIPMAERYTYGQHAALCDAWEALPSILSALDAARERIAELEGELGPPSDTNLSPNAALLAARVGARPDVRALLSALDAAHERIAELERYSAPVES